MNKIEVNSIFNMVSQNGRNSLNLPTLTESQMESETNSVVKNAPFVSNHLLVNGVDVRLLFVDNSYRRTPSCPKSLLNSFDEQSMGLLTVSYRDNKLFVVDGCRRVIAAIMNGLQYVGCAIYTDLTAEQEAKIFAAQGCNKEKLKPLESYKAGLVCNNPIDTAVRDICTKYRLDPFNPDRKYAPNIKGCRQAVAESAECLDWIFSVLNRNKWLLLEGGVSYRVLNAMKIIYINGVKNGCLDEYADKIAAKRLNLDYNYIDALKKQSIVSTIK